MNIQSIQHAQDLVKGFTEEDVATLMYALGQEVGITYCWWGRTDVESWLDREATDDEWDKVRHSKSWRDHIPDVVGYAAWETVGQVLDELGIHGEEP